MAGIALYTSSIGVHASSAHVTPTHVIISAATTAATPACKTATIQAKRPACQSLCIVMLNAPKQTYS